MKENNIVIRFMYYQPANKYKGKLRDYTKERNFVSCNSDFDYVKYITSGVSSGDYSIYIGNNEKCSGLFNENGYMNKKDIAELRKNLRATESNIWDMVISFREEFGNKYCKDYEQAHSFLKSELPKFFKRIGLDKDNVVWYAGLHENTENKHIHISFFEKKLKHIQNSGKLAYSKGSVKSDLLEVTKLSFENKLTNATSELYAMRKEITENLKVNLKDKELDDWTKREMLKLYEILPTNGRISYDSENMLDKRKNVIAFIENYTKKNKKFGRLVEVFQEEYDKYLEKAKTLYSHKVFTPYKMNLYRRMGNIVIQTALKVGKTHREIESISKYSRRQKIYKKNLRKREWDEMFRFYEQVHKEEQMAYEEFSRRVERMYYEEKRKEFDYARSRGNDYEM